MFPRWVWQEYDPLSVAVNGTRIAGNELSDVGVENLISEYNLKCDLWLLPFPNVYGMVGIIEGKIDGGLMAPFGKIKVS